MSQNTSRGWRNEKDSTNITISPILKRITESNSKENLESNINEILLSLQDQYQSSSESDMTRSKLISSFKKNDEKFASRKVQFNNFSERPKSTDETNKQNNIVFFSLKRKKEKNSYNPNDDDFETVVDLNQLISDKEKKQASNAAQNGAKPQKPHSIISRSKSDQTHTKIKPEKQNKSSNNKNKKKESDTKKDISNNESNENQAKSHQRQSKITRPKTDDTNPKSTNTPKSDDIDQSKKTIKRTASNKSKANEPNTQETKENTDENQAIKTKKIHSPIRRSITDSKSKAYTANVEEKIENFYKKDDVNPKKTIKRTASNKSKANEPKKQETKENTDEKQTIKQRKIHSPIRRSITDSKSKADADNVEEKIEDFYKKDNVKSKKAPKKKTPSRVSSASKESVVEQLNELNIAISQSKAQKDKIDKDQSKNDEMTKKPEQKDEKINRKPSRQSSKNEEIIKKQEEQEKFVPRKPSKNEDIVNNQEEQEKLIPRKPSRQSSKNEDITKKQEQKEEQIHRKPSRQSSKNEDIIKKQEEQEKLVPRKPSKNEDITNNQEEQEKLIHRKPSRQSSKEKQAQDSKQLIFSDKSSGAEVNATYSEEMKPEPMHFGLKFTLDQKPYCIAVGDIDGVYEKFERITKFIDENADLDFVFIGDVFDDLSDSNEERQNSWNIVTELADKYIKDKYEFKPDSEKQNHQYEDGDVVYLPSGFKDIHFKRISYKTISNNRVKFIAGNHECDALVDFQKFTGMVDNKYVFGEGIYMKSATFEQLCSLYKYLNRCYGVIFDQKENKGSNYINKIIFKHHILMFDPNKYSTKLLNQNIPITENEYNNGNYIIICGHSKIFSSSLSSKNRNVFLIDSNYGTSEICPKEGLGFGLNDNRIAIVNFDDNNNGFSVTPFIYPALNEFYKWEFNYSYKQMTKYIQPRNSKGRRSPNRNTKT